MECTKAKSQYLFFSPFWWILDMLLYKPSLYINIFRVKPYYNQTN